MSHVDRCEVPSGGILTAGDLSSANLYTRWRYAGSGPPNVHAKRRAAFQARRGRSGAALAATNEVSAEATCKRRDAAPVLFDRAALAAGAVRRLVRLSEKLGRAITHHEFR